MTEPEWSLGPADGQLRVRTGVVGPAAKMGHRLTLELQSWQAIVRWRGTKPVAAELSVTVDSLRVLKGEGGVTPLTGPEKAVARSNALKTLDAKKHPTIGFTAERIDKTAEGYLLTGSLQIRGTARPQQVALHVEDRGEVWAMSVSAPVVQSDFGVKPYSLMLGSLRVADEVTVEFEATRRK